MSFRLRWAASQLFDSKTRELNLKTLNNPRAFYIGLISKLVPGIHKKPVDLKLRDGGIIRIRQFMSLYIYKEIFVDYCYDEPSLAKIDEPVIVEVGGNTGMFTLRMKQLYPTASITTFEPFPPNFESLKETISLNNLNNVTPVQKAIANKNGTLSLFVHPTNIGGHSIYSHEESGKGTNVTVEAITINDALEQHGISHCDLLKLDCEGAEYDILMSMTEDHCQRIKRIVFEPSWRNYAVEDLKAYLVSIGYVVTDDGQGIVVAMSPSI